MPPPPSPIPPPPSPIPPPPSPILPAPPALTAAFSWLPAENFGTVAAGIVTFWLGLRGFTPWRSARRWVENFPKPVNATSCPPRKASVIESRKASTAFAASRLDRPAFDATSLTNSCFVKSLSSYRRLQPREKTLTGASDWLNHAVLRVFLRHPECRSHERSAATARRGVPTRPFLPPLGRPRRRPFRRPSRPRGGRRPLPKVRRRRSRRPRRDTHIRLPRTLLRPVSRSRTPSQPCGRSGRAGPRRASRRRPARRRRAPVRRAEPHPPHAP